MNENQYNEKEQKIYDYFLTIKERLLQTTDDSKCYVLITEKQKVFIFNTYCEALNCVDHKCIFCEDCDKVYLILPIREEDYGMDLGLGEYGGELGEYG